MCEFLGMLSGGIDPESESSHSLGLWFNPQKSE
jgi:hypothetical protein